MIHVVNYSDIKYEARVFEALRDTLRHHFCDGWPSDDFVSEEYGFDFLDATLNPPYAIALDDASGDFLGAARMLPANGPCVIS